MDPQKQIMQQYSSSMSDFYKSIGQINYDKSRPRPPRNNGPSPIHQGQNDIAKLKEALGLPKYDINEGARTADFQGHPSGMDRRDYEKLQSLRQQYKEKFGSDFSGEMTYTDNNHF